MTIKQQGGVFGRNPTFNDVSVENSLTVTGDLNVDSNTFFVESSTNRVGINNNNPTQELEVDGTIRVNLGVNDYAVGVVASGGGGFFLEPDDYTAANPIWKFRTFANENIGMYRGNSDCGTFTANGLAFPNGKGIDFSATAGTGTSELFDDYEEGTWTPVPADAASGGNTGTTASNVGLYTKVGNTVYVQLGMLNINTTGLTAGNDFFIQGLPFTAGNTTLTSYATGACVPSGNISYTGEVVVGITDNTSAIRLIETASGSNLDYILVSELTSGASDIWASLVYRTA